MSVEFDRKIHNTLADANLQLAIYTATGAAEGQAHRDRCARRAARLPGAAHPGQRRQEAHHREPGLLSRGVRAQRRSPWRQGGVRQGRHGSRRFRAGAGQRPRRAADRQIQVDDHRGGGSQRAPRTPRPRSGGDRSRRVHRATGARAAVSHRRAGAAHDPLRRGRSFHQAAQRSPRDGDREADRHRPRGAAPEVSGGRYRDQRGELPGGRLRRGGAGGERRQHPAHHLRAQDPHCHCGNREDDSARAGPGDVPETPGPQRHRPVAHGLHVFPQRPAAQRRDRRPRRILRGAAG